MNSLLGLGWLSVLIIWGFGETNDLENMLEIKNFLIANLINLSILQSIILCKGYDNLGLDN